MLSKETKDFFDKVLQLEDYEPDADHVTDQDDENGIPHYED